MIFLPKADSHKDSFQLIDKLKGIYFEENYKLISLLVSLFTNRLSSELYQ